MTAKQTTTPVTRQSLGAAWAVLVVTGGTSVTYNVYHAVANGYLNLFLALLYGVVPVLVAALLSHIVAQHSSDGAMKVITYAVMLGGMALSIGATGAVVGPAAGPWMRWLFGGVLDAAALVALRIILDSRTRRTAAEAEIEAAHTAANEAQSEARSALTRAAQLEAELATVRGELEAATAQPVQETTQQDRGAGTGPRTGRTAPGPKGARTAGTGPADDYDVEAQAVILLDKNPTLSGAKLAEALGLSEGYGRKLKRRLSKKDRPVEPAQDRSTEPAQDRSQDRP